MTADCFPDPGMSLWSARNPNSTPKSWPRAEFDSRICLCRMFRLPGPGSHFQTWHPPKCAGKRTEPPTAASTGARPARTASMLRIAPMARRSHLRWKQASQVWARRGRAWRCSCSVPILPSWNASGGSAAIRQSSENAYRLHRTPDNRRSPTPAEHDNVPPCPKSRMIRVPPRGAPQAAC